MFRYFLVIALFSFSVFAEESVSYDTALDLYKQGEYKKSISVLRALHVAGQNSLQSYYLEAHNNIKLEKYKTATAKLEAALEFSKDDPAVTIDLVKILIKRNSITEARERIERAIIAHPNIIDLRLLQANVLYRNKQPKGALQVIEQIKSLNTSLTEPLLMEAMIYYRLGEYEKAEVSLKWASELSPDNPDVMNNLGIIYEKIAVASEQADEKRKKLEDARFYLEKASEKARNNKAIAGNLERVIARLNES